MGELEDRLNSILSDPGQMEKIAGLARSLMGGESAAPEQSVPDAGLLQKLGFRRCGIIYVHEDRDPRFAYEKCSDDKGGIPI